MKEPRIKEEVEDILQTKIENLNENTLITIY